MKKIETFTSEMVLDLLPTNGRKSFYGKAQVFMTTNGAKILKSYNTLIAMITNENSVFRLCNEEACTATTNNHIKSFCGLNKKEFLLKDYKKIDLFVNFKNV